MTLGHEKDGKKKEERRFSTSYGARPRKRFGMHGRQRSKSNVSMQSQTISQVQSMVIHNDDDDDDDDSLSDSSEDAEEEEDFAAIDPQLSNLAPSPTSMGRSASAIVSSTSSYVRFTVLSTASIDSESECSDGIGIVVWYLTVFMLCILMEYKQSINHRVTRLEGENRSLTVETRFRRKEEFPDFRRKKVQMDRNICNF